MSKLKYLSALILSLTAIVALSMNGVWTYLTLLFAFGFIPLAELFFKPNSSNLSSEEKVIAAKDSYFSLILYIIVPIQISFLIFFLFSVQESLTAFEYTGRIISFGILCGIFGINVGHELGHRCNRFERFLGELLLLTSLETHFLPYHNNGHHYYVATPNDPATARLNEPVFSFWFRSQIGSYFKAWELTISKLSKKNKYFFSFSNSMFYYTLSQLALIALIYFFFDLKTLLAFILAAVFGILMLETVNYIEHYGLLRKLKENGKYERVQARHSWNSDHQIGRSVLFELSRHSDHHYKASKPYQLLDSFPESPQMITGYPGMMLLALVPPLWYNIMNKQLKYFHSTYLKKH